MDRAIWNNQEINIVNILKDSDTITAVDNASRKHVLKCSDCGADIQYCHGDKRRAYFRHFPNYAADCEYAIHSKAETVIIRTIRRMLYEHFSSQYTVLSEQKLINHHFTPLLIIKPDNSKLAIDIIPQNDLDKAEYLQYQYNKLNIPSSFIDISDTPYKNNLEDLSKLKRFILNQSNQKSVVAIFPEELSVRQYKLDTKKYEFNNRKILDGDIYQSEILPIDKLIIKDDEVCIKNFDEDFSKWLVQRKQKYDEIIDRIKKAEEQAAEEKKTIIEKHATDTNYQSKRNSIIHSMNFNDNIEQGRFDYSTNLNSIQNDLDNENRFYCNLCKRILDMEECVGYALPKANKILHGVCRDCLKNN